VKVIENDGFEIAAKVFNVLEGENLAAAAKTTGIGILELSSVFENIKPDIVVTIADRFETMATAIAASYMNIPLAHIQGGEVTGNIDEKVRHAITKLSDYHLVASQSAYDRVVKLGENKAFVYNTGCPSIDLAQEVLDNPSFDFDVFEKYGGTGKKQDLSTPNLKEYIENREGILSEIMNSAKVSKDEAKKIILSITNGGQIKNNIDSLFVYKYSKSDFFSLTHQ
jgi:UDP-hydrolysing UDP-N-acetyl-D-glucosamine 2-epimerase